MLVKQFDNVTNADDLQIQSACHRIGFHIEVAEKVQDEDGKPVKVRLRFISAKYGTITLIDFTDLHTVLEMDSQSEGFFEYTQRLDADGNVIGYGLLGSILVGVEGALKLAGGYLSVDVRGAQVMKHLSVETIDHPVEVRTYRRINPISVYGVARDIDLTGVVGLALIPNKIETISIQQGTRNIEYTGKGLEYVARCTNDIVYADAHTNFARHGFWFLTVLRTDKAHNARISPKDSNQFYQWLIEHVDLAD